MLPFNPRVQVRYPFSAERNPHAAEMDNDIITLIADNYSFLSEKARDKYRNTHIGYCAGCIFPKAGRTHLEAICRVFMWTFAVDDKFEWSAPAVIEEIGDAALRVLLGNKPAVETPLFNALPEMREQLLAIAGKEWLEKRFCKSLASYFSGLAEESHYRSSGIYPDMNTYLDIRLRSVNVDIMTNLAEVITAGQLPDSVIGHPVIREIELLVCRILIWCNDLFSVDEERKNMDVLNSVLITGHVQQCSSTEAALSVLSMHDSDVDRLMELSDSLPDFGVYNLVVQDYVANLQFMISGYLDWTLNYTGRYTAGGHAVSDMREIIT